MTDNSIMLYNLTSIRAGGYKLKLRTKFVVTNVQVKTFYIYYYNTLVIILQSYHSSCVNI